MIYIDIDTNPKVPMPKIGRTFALHPDENSFKYDEFIANFQYFSNENSQEYFKIELLLRNNLINWLNYNFPGIDNLAVIFCTKHLLSHIAKQYLNSYTTIGNVLRDTADTAIICTEKLKIIDSDWTCSAVNFLAALNAAKIHNRDIKFIETNNGILNDIIINGFSYIPYELIYKEQLAQNSNNQFLTSLLGVESIQCSMTMRYNGCLGENNLIVIPKSTVNDKNYIGCALQLNAEIGSNYNHEWEPCLAKCSIAEKFEKKLFECIFLQQLNPFITIAPKIQDFIGKVKSIKFLEVEEIVDFEFFTLISAARKLNIPIHLTQHSSNPTIDHLQIQEIDKVNLPTAIPSKIYFNNKASRHLYEKIFAKDIPIEASQNSFIKKNKSTIFRPLSNALIIIENDFFRNFGNSNDLPTIINEMIVFIMHCNSLGFKNYIWKQRSNDFNPMLEILKHFFKDTSFIVTPNASAENLLSFSSVAVGFGTTSTLALQIMGLGGLYYFPSKINISNEYVPNIELFYNHSPTGTLGVIKKISEICADTVELKKELDVQNQLFGEIWCI